MDKWSVWGLNPDDPCIYSTFVKTSFANCCELLAVEVILMYFCLSIFAECVPHGIISALAWRIMFGVDAKTVKFDSLISRIRKQCFFNLPRQQCLCTIKLITELYDLLRTLCSCWKVLGYLSNYWVTYGNTWLNRIELDDSIVSLGL